MRALILIALVGCVDSAADSSPTDQNELQSDGKADGVDTLWAGLTSVTLERYAQDPCDNDANQLGENPVVWDEWVRERAGVRNICFQVWSPGITDTDRADYWQKLDVEVHYRFGSNDWKMDYVPSIDRRGNNRRYAWSMPFTLDPMNAPSVPAVGAPLTIVSDSNGWAEIQKDLEVYFTVNGRVLGTPAGHHITVRFDGEARDGAMTTTNAGLVLHPLVTCDGLSFGGGAGFEGLDLTGAAIQTLGVGLDGSAIYGTPTALSPDGKTLSTEFSSYMFDAGQTLPSVRDGGGTRIIASGATETASFDVYEKAANTVQTLTQTFSNCVLVPQN